MSTFAGTARFLNRSEKGDDFSIQTPGRFTRQSDFFSNVGDEPFQGSLLRHDILELAINGELPDVSEIDLASILVQIVHRELRVFGTDGSNRIDDDDTPLLVRACTRCCSRIGVDFPVLPFRDLSGFRTYWISQGMSGSWEARRSYLESVFQPITQQVQELYLHSWKDELATPISPHSSTGWLELDAEIKQLRRRFEVARTSQDHAAVGTACVRVLEHLGDLAFDPDVHVPTGESIPTRDQTKRRFDLIVDHEFPGQNNLALRKLARACVELAHAVKHRQTPLRRDAGIAADSVILLANMIRRLRA